MKLLLIVIQSINKPLGQDQEFPEHQLAGREHRQIPAHHIPVPPKEQRDLRVGDQSVVCLLNPSTQNQDHALAPQANQVRNTTCSRNVFDVTCDLAFRNFLITFFHHLCRVFFNYICFHDKSANFVIFISFIIYIFSNRSRTPVFNG